MLDPKVKAATEKLIHMALVEDIGKGDLTAQAIPENSKAKAFLVAKKPTVISGLEIIPLILEQAGMNVVCRMDPSARDGYSLPAGAVVFELEGNARQLLTVERTLLNFLQRLFGIATYAKQHKDALGGKILQILDTRKTTPGLRYWEKKAVRDGGLSNHRFCLDDGILIKENHIRAAGSIAKAIRGLQGKIPMGVVIEVEVTKLEEAREAVANGISRLLLDNIPLKDLPAFVQQVRKLKQGLFLEASGGINISNIAQYATTGVNAVSVGALTHSVPAADISLQFEFR